MVTMTITLPDPLADWVDQKVRDGHYGSTSDYVRDLIVREREQADERPDALLTIDDLRRIVAEARAGGISTRTVRDIVAEGDRIARERGFFRE